MLQKTGALTVAKGLFEDEIRWRRSKETIKRISRVSRGYDQAVVKVGYLSGRRAVMNHASYISRKNELLLEAFEGSKSLELHDKEDMDQVVSVWADRFDNRKRSRDVATIILSTPEGTNTDSALQSAKEFASEEFSEHEYMLALHTDTQNPHVHLMVEMRDRNDRKLRLEKKDLKRLRETFAKKCRDNHIQVEASYRTERGKHIRSPKQFEKHIDPKKHRNKKKLKRDAVNAANQLLEGNKLPVKPWHFAMRKNHRKLTNTLKKAYEYFLENGDVEQAALIKAQLEKLPQPFAKKEILAIRLLQTNKISKQPHKGKRKPKSGKPSR